VNCECTLSAGLGI